MAPKFPETKNSPSPLPLIPRLLLSFDRSQPPSNADAIGRIAALHFHSGAPYVVGVDLGGNPTKGSFVDFLPALQAARLAGLKVSVHCGEVPCSGLGPAGSVAAGVAPVDRAKWDEAAREAELVVAFRPDRLGHALFLPAAVVRALELDPIPVECCPTSNVMTLSLQAQHRGDVAQGLRRHPMLERWLEIGYPISISTDDSGVFDTDSTKELLVLAEAMGIDEWQIAGVVWGSLDHVFEQNRRVRSHLARDVSMSIKKLLRKLNITLNNEGGKAGTKRALD